MIKYRMLTPSVFLPKNANTGLKAPLGAKY
jgi:hypothetical protein